MTQRRHPAILWMTDAWRPIAAFVYLAVCAFDFIIAPGLYIILHPDHEWVPVTLAQSGLFHISFGAILSAASWTHGQEKIIRARAALSGSSVTYEKQVQNGPPAAVPDPSIGPAAL